MTTHSTAKTCIKKMMTHSIFYSKDLWKRPRQTKPQARQWWRRRRTVNGVLQRIHMLVSWSLIHTGARQPRGPSSRRCICTKTFQYYTCDLVTCRPTRAVIAGIVLVILAYLTLGYIQKLPAMPTRTVIAGVLLCHDMKYHSEDTKISRCNQSHNYTVHW